jgi:hypothetical protein
MTTVVSKAKDYRLLVGARYLDASDMLLKGMRAVHQEHPFDFLVSLRSFIEYTRRGIWFLVWASNDQLREAEHLTFNQAGSPSLIKMDAMLNKAMGAGKISHLNNTVDGVNEPFIDCLHALTHGNPVSVRFIAVDLTRVFDIPKSLARAEHELNIYRLLHYRRVAGMPQNDIWKPLASIHDKPQSLYEEVIKAATDVKKQGGMKIEWRLDDPTTLAKPSNPIEQPQPSDAPPGHAWSAYLSLTHEQYRKLASKS